VARKRAPGGGRKPKGPYRGKSVTITTRVTPDTRVALERAGAKKGHSLSQEIEIRLRQSLLRRANAPVHVGALLYGMSLLVDEIERDTGKRFIDDAFTGEAVRSALESLIYHFAQRPTGPFQVPADVDRMASKMQSSLQAPLRDPSMFGQTKAGLYITLIENARSPDEIAGRVLRPDRWGFWQILSDLGSGWQRNRKSRNKGAQP